MTRKNNNSTKCPYLDEKGAHIYADSGITLLFNNVDIKDKEVIDYCLTCKLPECIPKEKDDAAMKKRRKKL